MKPHILILAFASLILLAPLAAWAVTCHETCYDIGGGMTSCTRSCH